MGVLPSGPFGGKNKDAKDTGYYRIRTKEKRREQKGSLSRLGPFFFFLLFILVLEEEEASLSGT